MTEEIKSNDKERIRTESAVKLFGFILIIIGILFLLNQLFPVLHIRNLWPIFLLIPVGILTSILVSKGKEAAGVIIPIVILSILFVYFIIINFIGWHYAATTWPIFVLAPGLGLFAFFLMSGKWPVLIPAAILTFLSIIFYGTMFRSNVLIAICFIAGGILLIGSSKIRKKA